MAEKGAKSLVKEVDRYLAEADALKYQDVEGVLKAAQAAAVNAHMLGDFHRYAQALSHQAWAYCLLNRYELSLSYALEVLVLARDYRLLNVEARTVGIIAANFLKLGVLNEAIVLFEHQYLLAQRLGDVASQAMALNDQAVTRMELNDFEAATELLQQAVALMPSDIHGGMDKSIAHLNLAYASVKTGDYIAALEHARIVLDRMPDGPRYRSDAYIWLARAHLGLGDLDEARAHLAQARAALSVISPPLYNDNVEQLTAELLSLDDRHAEAVQVWEMMYRVAMEQEQLDYAITTLNHLKVAYERMGDTTGLLSAYKRLSEDIPAQQHKSSDLRFAVLRMIFAIDKKTLEAELNLSERKNAILRRLSHEFRTPLAIIQTSTHLMDRYADRLTLAQRQERLQQITDQVAWMTVMLDDMLEVLRLEDADDILLAFTTFHLRDLAQAALYQLDAYRLSNQRVMVQIIPSEARVTSARNAVQTILVHLLTNALKFSEGEVRLVLTLDGDILHMLVADEGIGIPAGEIMEVLKPLVRGSNLNEVGGNGLGLAIVARLVERLKGSIRFDSLVGVGTTVTVHLPVS